MIQISTLSIIFQEKCIIFFYAIFKFTYLHYLCSYLFYLTKWYKIISLCSLLEYKYRINLPVRSTTVHNRSNSEQKYKSTNSNEFNIVIWPCFQYASHEKYCNSNILWITNDLSRVLQIKDQDIVNAMNSVNFCKDIL